MRIFKCESVHVKIESAHSMLAEACLRASILVCVSAWTEHCLLSSGTEEIIGYALVILRYAYLKNESVHERRHVCKLTYTPPAGPIARESLLPHLTRSPPASHSRNPTPV